MSARIRREDRRLRALFDRALILAMAPLAPACVSEAEQQSAGGVQNAADAGLERDATVDADAATDACAPVPFDAPDADACGTFVHLPCGLPPDFVPGSGGGCYLLLKDCKNICSGPFFSCLTAGSYCQNGTIVVEDGGSVDIDCVTCPMGGGRAPEGLAPLSRSRSTSHLGDYFAAMAHLESASVPAFRRLHDELAALGAPRSLLRACRRARRDEIRHTRVMERLARAHGGSPVPAEVAPETPRDVEAFLNENLVEGCVRETFGALLARFQATHAEDPATARVMRTIARDEAKHAALAHAVHRWAWPALDAAAQRRLTDAKGAALEELRLRASRPIPEKLRRAAGLPTPSQCTALVEALRTA